MSASTFSKGRATSVFMPVTHSSGGNVIGVVADCSVTAANSANDVYRLIKVPNQARVMEGIAIADSSGAFTIQVGDEDTAAAFGTFSVSGTLTNFRFKLPIGGKKYSTSANATDQFKYMQVKLTAIAGSTAAAQFGLNVFYITNHINTKTTQG